MSIPWLLEKIICTVPHIYSLFCRALVLSHILCNFVVWDFYFCFDYFCLLFLLLSPNSSPVRAFNVTLRPNISWTGVTCSLVWFMIRTEKVVAARIPDQWSSSSR